MIKVYVAGAYSAGNVLDVLNNIGRGEALAARIFADGFAPFCPWHNKDFVIKEYNRNIPLAQLYEYSMEWLKVSDCLFLVSGWENSKGTLAEIKKAKSLGLPVFSDYEDLIRFKDYKGSFFTFGMGHGSSVAGCLAKRYWIGTRESMFKLRGDKFAFEYPIDDLPRMEYEFGLTAATDEEIKMEVQDAR